MNISDDPKTELQEWFQHKYKKIPIYFVLRKNGLSHSPIFFIQVSLPTGQSVVGLGRSKNKAEHSAARLLLSKYRFLKNNFKVFV